MGLLPTRLELGNDEALDSYLERLAVGNGLDAAQMLRLITTPSDERSPSGAFMMIRPDPSMVNRISQLGGIAHGHIESATLIRYSDGLPIHLDGFDPLIRDSFRNVVAQGWFPQTGTQVCPHCLEQSGQWHLHWRLPLVTMCSVHNTMLVARCDGCGERFRVRRYSPLRPNLGPHQSCGNQLGLRQHCDHSVLDHSTEDAEPDLRQATAVVARALLGGSIDMLGQRTDARTYLAELRHIATLLLHLATRPTATAVVPWAHELQAEATSRRSELRGPRWGISPPNSARIRGAALGAAHEILMRADLAEAAAALSPWLVLIADVPNGPHSWAMNRTVRTPTTQALIGAASQRHRISRRINKTATATMDETRLPLSAIPQTIDPDTYSAHFAGMLGGYESTGRLYVSLCIVRSVAGLSNWSEAAESLGLEADLGRRTARAASARMRVPPAVFEAAVHATRRSMSRVTDFRRREAAVCDLAANHELWFYHWCSSVTPRRRAVTLPHAITWMWCTVAQGLVETSPVWKGELPSRHWKAAHRVFSDSLPATAGQQLRTMAVRGVASD
ncbi:TniQ family protein [Mycolicibacterium alvei]|nr:TniQ family protein [Mycolicibacterium alvei]